MFFKKIIVHIRLLKFFIKPIKSLLIFTYLIFLTLPTLTQANELTLDKQISFLIRQKNYSQIAMDVNLDHIKKYLNCLSDESRSMKVQYFSDSGSITEIKKDCSNIIERVFRIRLETYYPLMRRYLALSNTEFETDLHSMSLSEDPKYKIKINLHHPNSTTIKGLPFRVAELPALTPNEITAAMKLYNENTYTQCLKFKRLHIVQEFRHPYLSKVIIDKDHMVKNFCSEPYFLQKRIQREENSLIKKALQKTLKNYHTWLELSRKQMRKLYLEKYYKEINMSPYFLLVNSENPSREDLKEALEVIYVNAQNLKQKHNSYTLDNNINTRIDLFHQGDLTFSQKSLLLHSLKFYLNNSGYERLLNYFKDVSIFYKIPLSVDQPSDRLTQKEMDQLIREEENDEMIKDIATIGTALLSCYFPQRGLIKYLKINKLKRKPKNFFKNLCFVTLGLPVNTYFLTTNFLMYSRKHNAFLSSPEGQHVFENYSQLDSYEQNILLSTIFLGIGVGPIKKVVREIF